jgi:hypothetical protein
VFSTVLQGALRLLQIPPEDCVASPCAPLPAAQIAMPEHADEDPPT